MMLTVQDKALTVVGDALKAAIATARDSSGTPIHIHVRSHEIVMRQAVLAACRSVTGMDFEPRTDDGGI